MIPDNDRFRLIDLWREDDIYDPRLVASVFSTSGFTRPANTTAYAAKDVMTPSRGTENAKLMAVLGLFFGKNNIIIIFVIAFIIATCLRGMAFRTGATPPLPRHRPPQRRISGCSRKSQW